MHSIEIGKGERPEIVFAHGWARSHHDFIPAAEALIAQHRSILIDLPGFGATPLRRVVGADTFTPLAGAAFLVLPGEADVVAAARELA